MFYTPTCQSLLTCSPTTTTARCVQCCSRPAERRVSLCHQSWPRGLPRNLGETWGKPYCYAKPAEFNSKSWHVWEVEDKMSNSLGKPAYLLCRYPFSVDQLVPECDWEVFLRETASMIVEQQSPQRHVHSCKCTICIPIHRVIVMDKVLWHSSHLFDSADY